MNKIILKKEDIYKGDLILINRRHLLKIKENEIKEELVEVNDKYEKVLIRKDIQKILKDIFENINSKGKIVTISGFRSKQEQTILYNISLKENGKEYTKKFVAKPDTSEHQSALAIDLGEYKKNIDYICPDFPYHGVFNKFRDEGRKRGFIERYKEGKELITGISKEPWHFRYVGFPHSDIIEEYEFAFEEYHNFIRKYDSVENSYRYKTINDDIKIFFVESNSDIQIIQIEDDYEYTVSGNNFDGFIITLFKRFN